MSGTQNPQPTPQPTPVETPPTNAAETPPVEAAKEVKPPENILADEKPAEGEKAAEGDKKDKAPEGAPEKYEDFKVPEGVTLQPEMLGEFTTLAKEANLSQATAQRLVDAHVKAMTAAAEQSYQLWVDTNKQWQKEVNDDPIIGGARLPEVKQTIAKALQEFGDPKVREALIATGAGNNPAIIKTLYNMSKKLTEGGLVTGRAPNQKPQTAAQAIYPNLP